MLVDSKQQCLDNIYDKGPYSNSLFGKSDVIKLIKALDVGKADGHDGISVKMIKICADSIAHPLTLTFQSSLAASIFSNS